MATPVISPLSAAFPCARLVGRPLPAAVVMAMSMVLAAGMESVAWGAEATPPAFELPKVPSAESLLWSTSLSLRASGGYKDNPRLSALNPVGSGFVAGGGELMVVRMPADGREFSVFASVDHLAYTARGFDPETLAAVEARYEQKWGEGWSAGTGVEYLFLKQVFDASEIEGTPLVLPALGHTLTWRPVVGRAWAGERWRVEAEFEATRQWLATPLDSYDDLAPKLAVVRSWGRHRSLGLSYRWRDREFDERTRVDTAGSAVGGTLRYQLHEAEVPWRYAWGKGDRWRMTLRPGWVRNLDNGGGFYDYDRLQVGAGLRYLGTRWEGRIDGRARWYLYPVQTNGGSVPEARRRTDLSWTFRLDWKPRTGVRCFGQYEWEFSDENLVAADYDVNAVSAGIEFEW